MKPSQIIAVVVAIAIAAWIASGFFMAEPEASKAPAEEVEEQEKPLPKVRVREITAEAFSDTVVITGRSQASRTVEVKAEISGAVSQILKEEGLEVAQDDVMAELDVRDREARKAEARERVNQREIEYNAAKKLADKGFNSKVRLAQALADLEDAKAALKDANLDLDNVKITAPFDGIIAEQGIDLGDYVDIGNVLFTVVDLDPIEFVGFVSERRVRELQKEMKAHVEFLDGEVQEGKVSYIAPAADSQTRTFRIIVSAENTEQSIKEGLTAKLSIPVANKKAHKISPSILSLSDDGIVGVKTVNADDIVEFTPVKILSDKPEAMWITGPNETDRFITVGQEFVIEGQKVEPIVSDKEGSLL